MCDQMPRNSTGSRLRRTADLIRNGPVISGSSDSASGTPASGTLVTTDLRI